MKDIKLGKMKPKRQFSPMRAIMMLLLMGFATGNAMAQYKPNGEPHRVQNPNLYMSKKFDPTNTDQTEGILTLESYVTGQLKTITTHVPTDIVLVLDMSTSMKNDMYAYTAREYGPYSYNGYGTHSYYFKDGNNYYKVSRSNDNVYTAHTTPSGGYKYINYPSSTLFCLYNGNYYEVHLSGTNNKRYLYISVNSSNRYLHPDGTIDRTRIGYGNSQAIWNGTLYDLSTVYYRLSYTKDGVTYYLSGTGVTETPPTNITSNTATIWTGILYNYVASGQSRLAALKSAAQTFVGMIAQDAKDFGYYDDAGIWRNVDHKISIVTYNSTAVTQCELLNAVENESYLKTMISGFSTANYTCQDLGLEKAFDILPDPVPNSETGKYGRKNVVVLFTDGAPYPSSGGNNANNVLNLRNCAIENAHDLKIGYTETTTRLPLSPGGGAHGKDATVYALSAYGDDVTNDDKLFLKYLSSDYEDAMSMSNYGTPIEDAPKFSFEITCPDQLNSVFETIASESGGSGEITLGVETVVQDVISEFFELPPLPEGTSSYADLCTLKFYKCNGVGTPNTGNYDEKGRSFETDETLPAHFDPALPAGIVPTLSYSKNPETEAEIVQVTGFNFSDYWCGQEVDGHGNPTGNYMGYKVVIEIPIQVKDNVWGDNLPTNGPMSVISEDNTYETIAGEFITPTHNITRDTWVEHVMSKPDDWDPSNIDSAEDLAWLISVVCGYNNEVGDPRVDATITADIDMSAYNWVPIGGSEGYYTYDDNGNPHFTNVKNGKAGYQGTFDGGGHAITGLRNQPSKVKQPGLIGNLNGGTVKNTFVMDCDFNTGCEGYFGIIADTVSNGGCIFNSEAAGTLTSSKANDKFLNPNLDPSDPDSYYIKVDPYNVYLGGVAGLVGVNTTDVSEVHSCISVADINGYSMGGVVNQVAKNATLANSYSFASYLSWKLSAEVCLGGLAAVNEGKILNCYLRERKSNCTDYSGGIHFAMYRIYALLGKSQPEGLHMGLAIGYNDGSANYVYIPNEWDTGDQIYPLQDEEADGEIKCVGKFTKTETPYMYLHDDNKVTAADSENNTHLVSTFPSMLQTLNHWVDNSTRDSKYTHWFRTTANGINNDYPVLKIMNFNTVGSDDNVRLYYGDINDLMGAGNDLFAEGKVGDTLCLYQNAAVTTGNNGATLYINEDVAITQEESLDAFVGITLDNSAHPDGGASQSNPNDPTQYDYGENTRDWHMFSTSLSNAPLGVNYTDNTQYAFFYDNTINMPKYAFNDESVEDGYFPSHRYGKESDDEEYNYYKEWDYYCWSEPYNHWINFKRNSASHWAENIQTLNLGYTNETTLTPGKGYLLAIANETFLQSHGTLNQGNVIVPLTYSRMNEMSRGFNFVGNPYQSYLDFNEFATVNPSITSYTLLDEDEGAYVTYAATASRNSKSASQFINMHQGFLVFTDGSVEKVTFTESMRDIEATTTTFRGGEKASFTLVNLILTESDGKREIVTVETGRPEMGGAHKMMGLLNGKSQLYAHCDGESYSVLFATDEMHTVPVRFRTYQDDSFTLTWDVENGSLDELYLVDNITGQTVDMLTHSQYVFEGRTTDFSSRFKLVFGNGTVDEPAEGEVIEDIFAYQNEDNLMVTSEGHFEMYDMSGRLVQCVNLYNDFNTVALPRMSRGVYTLRLTNNTDTKVQKIVIR